MEKLIIDPEFRDKIPPMPPDDFEGLKADILRDGYVRDPLVVWKEENTLLDGHHRWKVICENEELLKDKFSIDYKSFPDRWAAIAWICANQLHKHNMTELQRMKLIQEEHDARQRASGFQKGHPQYKPYGGEIHHHTTDDPEIVRHGAPGKQMKTRPTIAKEHNISESEVKTAVEVGRGIDRAAKVDPDFRREVLSGETKATKQDLAAIRKMKSDEEVSGAIDAIRNRKSKNQPPKTSIEPKSDYAKSRELSAAIRKTSADMASAESSKYTQSDLISELRVIRDEFVSKVKNTLKVRKSVIGNGEKVIEVLVSCGKQIIEIENQIGV